MTPGLLGENIIIKERKRISKFEKKLRSFKSILTNK